MNVNMMLRIANTMEAVCAYGNITHSYLTPSQLSSCKSSGLHQHLSTFSILFICITKSAARIDKSRITDCKNVNTINPFLTMLRNLLKMYSIMITTEVFSKFCKFFEVYRALKNFSPASSVRIQSIRRALMSTETLIKFFCFNFSSRLWS